MQRTATVVRGLSRGTRRILVAAVFGVAACNPGVDAASDSARDTTVTSGPHSSSQRPAYSGTRFTQDEADAIATLTRPARTSDYRETPGVAAFALSGVVEAEGSITGDSLIEPTHDHSQCRPFRDVITPRQREGVGNAIVWIGGITSGKPNMLARRTSIRLDGCRLEPRVHLIAQGGTVLVGSRDAMESRIRLSDVLANGEAPRSIIPLSDFGQVVPGPDIARTAGLVEVTDDRHPWVHGYIAVSAHPYITVTNAAGAFQLDGVPAGVHELIVFSESLGIMRRMVEVKADTHVELKFSR